MKKLTKQGLEIGYRVNVCRRACDLTKSKLAELTGVLPASISALERGLISTPPFIPQLSKALGVDAGWLMYGGSFEPDFYRALDDLKKIRCA